MKYINSIRSDKLLPRLLILVLFGGILVSCLITSISISSAVGLWFYYQTWRSITENILAYFDIQPRFDDIRGSISSSLINIGSVFIAIISALIVVILYYSRNIPRIEIMCGEINKRVNVRLRNVGDCWIEKIVVDIVFEKGKVRDRVKDERVLERIREYNIDEGNKVLQKSEALGILEFEFKQIGHYDKMYVIVKYVPKAFYPKLTSIYCHELNK